MINTIVKSIFSKIHNILNKGFYKIKFPLIDNLPSDISEYLGINKDEFLYCLKMGSYHEKYRDYKYNYRKWLLNSFYYFYDLCEWHLKDKLGYVLVSIIILFSRKKLKILDFGSGIGTRALIMSRRNEVTLVEINKNLLNFSKWRFKKYNRKADFYPELPKGKIYDIIFLVDVIGHLTEPIKTINQVCSSLKKGGFLKVTFDNFKESSSRDIHRNKEINFHRIFEQKGLSKIDHLLFNYKKK